MQQFQHEHQVRRVKITGAVKYRGAIVTKLPVVLFSKTL